MNQPFSCHSTSRKYLASTLGEKGRGFCGPELPRARGPASPKAKGADNAAILSCPRQRQKRWPKRRRALLTFSFPSFLGWEALLAETRGGVVAEPRARLFSARLWPQRGRLACAPLLMQEGEAIPASRRARGKQNPERGHLPSVSSQASRSLSSSC